MLCLTTKPAVLLRNPKPDVIRWACRLARVLATISYPIQASTATNRIWTKNPPHPARPPSARRNLAANCGGGGRGSMLIAAPRGPRSADRRRVLNPALVPELVEPTGNPEFRAGADVTIEGFAVIADRLDDPRYPILGEAELFAEIAIGAEHALELRLVRFGHVIDVLLGNAEFFGIDHRKQHPFDDIEPLIVAVANHRAERLFRDHLGKHGVIGRIGKLQTLGIELGDVRGEDVAAPGLVGLDGFVGAAERDHLILHVVALEVIGEILLGRGAGLHAD